MRGMFLLALIGVLVTFVLVLIFWRPAPPVSTQETPPEHVVPLLIAPTLANAPGHVSWPAVYQLSQTLPSEPGWEVRYNAAATLARRGSTHVPWPLFQEMLDPKLQLRNQRVRQPDGRDVYDEVAARSFTLIALKALATWHEKQPKEQRTAPPELLRVYARVDALAESPYLDLKEQAEKTRTTFFRN